MPRFVRPSWIDLSVDGYRNNISAGPRSKNGTLTAQFKVRENGCVINSVTIETIVYNDDSQSQFKGKLCQELIVRDEKGQVIHIHKTYL